MRFDLHLRNNVLGSIRQLTEKMKAWESMPEVDTNLQEQLQARIVFFEHTRQRDELRIAGVDGGGDYPALSYADSFVYFSVAQAVIYQTDRMTGLKEIGPTPETAFHFTWLPEAEQERQQALDDAFSTLAGVPLEEVIKTSDYRQLAKSSSVTAMMEGLIRPHAADAGNLAIQLRTSAELGTALRLLRSDIALDYLLVDGTLSLPFVGKSAASLFHEHLKRLCCVEAGKRDIGFIALSKSHGLPGVEYIETLAKQKTESNTVAEHWYLRLPVPNSDQWEFPPAHERLIPPPGAVTYLFRCHRNVPVMRLDVDRDYWRKHIYRNNAEQTLKNERQLFENLDYASHDQRCYGYPYPIKAAHDRASLSQAERVALRKQIIDAAVQAGMKRSLFRDASQATGHA